MYSKLKNKIKMKKTIKLLFVMVLMINLTSCSLVRVNGDEEAVLISKPLIFGHGGVSDSPVTSGSEMCAVSTDGIVFKTSPIAYIEKFENLISDDNVPLDFETHLTLRIQKLTTPELYKNFGTDWYMNNVSNKFRSLVRDLISSYKMQDLISNRQIMSRIDSVLEKELTVYFKEINLPVDIKQVTIGAATPPAEVLVETQKTAAQNQSVLTQKARATAETSRKQAEINKAEADNAYRQTMQMTMEEYLHLRQLEIEKEKLEVAKGSKNISVIMGNAQPMFNIK